MQMERKALYNLMRMNWLLDPTIAAEPWQVEDYRALSLETLFNRLKAHDLEFDKNSFVAFADEAADPEELTDQLLADVEANIVTQDQVYLLIFELWRRLIGDRPTLSLFCDELDHQIYLYDHAENKGGEAIQDAVANLQVILDENADAGANAHEVLASLGRSCANDIESFLYDYISDQIDSGQEAYASELLDGFSEYVSDPKWFNLLRARLIAFSAPEQIGEMVRNLYARYEDDQDLDFDLELLHLSAHDMSDELFIFLVGKVAPLLAKEGDFQDVLNLSADFFRKRQKNDTVAAIQKILTKRSHLHLDGVFNPKDPQLRGFLVLFPKLNG